MQRVKVEVEPTRSALATAILNSKTTPQERLWDTALKFLCSGLFITSPDHLVNFALGVLSYVCKESSFASPPWRHVLAWRSPNSKSLNFQEKREPESKLIVNLCSLRSYEEYGKNQTMFTEKKRLYCSLALKEVNIYFFKQRT